MLIDVVVPTYYGKKNIIKKTIENNIQLLNEKKIKFRYKIIVDYYMNIDCRFDYFNIHNIDNEHIDLYFKINRSSLKEQFHCINFGLKISNSDYIIIMDDDYLITEEYLNFVIDSIEKKYDCIFLNDYKQGDDVLSVSEGDVFCGMNYCSGLPKAFRRSFLYDNDLFFNERFLGYMYCDNEFCHRVMKRTNPIVGSGSKMGVSHIEHDYFFSNRKIEKQYIHLKTQKRNEEIFKEIISDV